MTKWNEVIDAAPCSRRTALQFCASGLFAAGGLSLGTKASQVQGAEPAGQLEPRPWVKVRGTYGGFPQAILTQGKVPADNGINAVWVGSGGLKQAEIDRYHDLGVKVYAEFNSMHAVDYLKNYPDAAPIGPDGKTAPPAHDWQGVSPFHAGYRKSRMNEFRRVLQTFSIDGIWLDYHHAHASWERPDPLMPDTDFSPVALHQFAEKTGHAIPEDASKASALLLGELREEWTQFRCDVYTDWVREYREILNAVRPKALLGTFHCPWAPDDFDDAIRHKLAIDLPAQAKYLDVFSIMPYHARFGHGDDPAWIARQTKKLGDLLGIQGSPDEKKWIWPIVQLADWEQKVSPAQIPEIIDFGTRLPATGVMVFHWGGILQQPEKADALRQAYLAIAGKPE